MRIKVKLLPRGKKFKVLELDDDATGQELFEKLKIEPDAHIITNNGDPIPLDEQLQDGEKICIIKVVSGG